MAGQQAHALDSLDLAVNVSTSHDSASKCTRRHLTPGQKFGPVALALVHYSKNQRFGVQEGHGTCSS